jgi:cell wall assembly regulator SMI1
MSPLDDEPGDLTKDLDRILAGLDRLGRKRIHELLRPGVPQSRTRQRLEELALAPPRDLCELYAWRDGTDIGAATTLDEVYLFPGYYFLALEDAVAEYRARIGDGWHAAWVAMFADGGGGFFAVTCDPAESEFGQVVGLDGDGFPPAIAFFSIGRMVATIAQAYDDDMIHCDDDGYLEWDDEAFRELASRMNPGTPYWQQ